GQRHMGKHSDRASVTPPCATPVLATPQQISYSLVLSRSKVILEGMRFITLLNGGLLLALMSGSARAQVNAGEKKPEPSLPFTMTQVATFNLPWRIAFLPDGRMLITEKPGPVWLVTQQGQKTSVENVPAVLHQGQGGMLGVFLS